MGCRRMCLPLRISEEHAASIFYPKMETFLRNISKCLPNYTVPHPT